MRAAGGPNRARGGWADRLPRHAWALGICALALLLGLAVADDYGVWIDTDSEREVGEAVLRHLAGDRGALDLLQPPWHKFYGAVFEVPLALVERILGPDDSRSIYLVRHLLTHLLFLAAGFAGYLLVWQLFGSRWLALFALVLFLLHPRIYAQSFINSKDMPFLAMFMICLWLAHRAFGKGTAGAFVLCGVAAGLLTNLRIMGLAFVAIVFFARLWDVIPAGGWRQRRRIVASSLVFALAAAATYYATMPYLWGNPLERFAEVISLLSAHPTDPLQLFQGELVRASALPPIYLPVWFSITTPLLALLLGAVGFAAVLWRGVAGWLSPLATSPASVDEGSSPSNTSLRFELLVGACFVLPVLAVVLLEPTLYDDWRHFYFLWAPFVLLAASGLRTLAEGARDAGQRFLPRQVPAATVVGGLAALGLGAIAVEMARMHPDQNRYFNVLATGPHTALPLSRRYSQHAVGPYRSITHILEELAARDEPDAVFNVKHGHGRRWAGPLGIARHNTRFALLSQGDLRRLTFDPDADVDFFHVSSPDISGLASLVTPAVLYERRLYGEPIMQVATPDLSRVHKTIADVYRALYRDVTAGAPALSGETDVYRGETAVTWVRESCPAGGVNRTQRMIVVPLDAARVLQRFGVDGVRVGAACLWQRALPDYAIGKILFFGGIGALVSDAWLQELRRRHAALSAAPPAARSTFDVYLEDGALFYIRTACVEADTEAPFFVHVWPAHPGDLHYVRRQHGFDALDFRFGASKSSWRTVAGDIFDGVCMATLELPDYPIANIATGQYTPGGGGPLWRVDIGGG